MFHEVNPHVLLLKKTQELEELDGTMKKFETLYVGTAKQFWKNKEYSRSIGVDKWWKSSPLHTEHKQLKSYVYELQSAIGRSNRLSPMDIERARAVPLSRILGGKGPFKCPFHGERTASLNIKRNFYCCFGCQAKGDNIKLVMEMNHINFRSAVLYILEHE